MGSIVFCLMAAGFTCLSSLFFRKNADNSTTTSSASGYLVLFYFFSFILSFIIYPDIWKVNINWIIMAIGASVGLLNSTLMLLTSRALRRGPAGLTFAFQNASAIFPGMILFLLLGTDFGFSCSLMQFAGMAFVLLGLFLSVRGRSSDQPKASFKWLKYVLASFFIQILALTIIQSRCILFNFSELSIFSFNFSLNQADDIWFMPGQFGASFAMQALMFLREKRKFQKSEIVYGSFAGIANFSANCLLLLATKFALPFEKGIIFPCFAVAAMILCNIWANRLYNEKINLKTNGLCSFGIFMAVSG